MLETMRTWMRDESRKAGLETRRVVVSARGLSPEEAIGSPTRRDYPIITGKERMLEARLDGALGQAFTDAPRDLVASLADIINGPLTDNRERGVFVAAANAMAAWTGLVGDLLHCRDDEPEECGQRIAAGLKGDPAQKRVGLIGMNPAMAEALVAVFGPRCVTITDRAEDIVGTERFGVEILDGHDGLDILIERSDVVLMTGTTLVNGTWDEILERVDAAGIPVHVFGVTGAAACALLGRSRLCPCAHEG
jgi:hypothetical protein